MTEAADRVVVVGGGVIGAATAYYLAKAGRRVTLIDRGKFGDGCSHANCGYVCPSHVLPLAVPGAVRATLATLLTRNSPLKVRPGVVLRHLGWFRAFAKRCREADMLAAGRGIQALLNSSRTLYDGLIRDETLDCEWQTKGLLFVFQSARAMNHYAHTDELLRSHFGVPARRLDGDKLTDFEPALKPGLAGGYLYESDAHLRPDKLMRGLRRTLETLGVDIREDCAMTGFTSDSGRARAVTTTTGDVPAAAVVVATGAWTPQLNEHLGCRVPIQPGKGYSVTLPQPAGAGPTYPMIFEEHRVAVTPFADGLRVGSTMEFAGYDAALDPRRLSLLTRGAALYLREPPAGPPADGWWGWRPMTPDGLPVIDRSPKLANVWVAAGHGMLGLSMAPATGKLVAELVTGRPPHVDPAAYAVGRF